MHPLTHTNNYAQGQLATASSFDQAETEVTMALRMHAWLAFVKEDDMLYPGPVAAAEPLPECSDTLNLANHSPLTATFSISASGAPDAWLVERSRAGDSVGCTRPGTHSHASLQVPVAVPALSLQSSAVVQRPREAARRKSSATHALRKSMRVRERHRSSSYSRLHSRLQPTCGPHRGTGAGIGSGSPRPFRNRSASMRRNNNRRRKASYLTMPGLVNASKSRHLQLPSQSLSRRPTEAGPETGGGAGAEREASTRKRFSEAGECDFLVHTNSSSFELDDTASQFSSWQSWRGTVHHAHPNRQRKGTRPIDTNTGSSLGTNTNSNTGSSNEQGWAQAGADAGAGACAGAGAGEAAGAGAKAMAGEGSGSGIGEANGSMSAIDPVGSIDWFSSVDWLGTNNSDSRIYGNILPPGHGSNGHKNVNSSGSGHGNNGYQQHPTMQSLQECCEEEMEEDEEDQFDVFRSNSHVHARDRERQQLVLHQQDAQEQHRLQLLCVQQWRQQQQRCEQQQQQQQQHLQSQQAQQEQHQQR